MRTKNVLAASAATAALIVTTASPVLAGESPIVELDPNPAHVGDTVTATPITGCPDWSTELPTVEVEITGPEDSSFSLDPTEGDFYHDWTAEFTAGPVGVYTVSVSCVYPLGDVDTGPTGRQQSDVFNYSPATLQVIAQVTTTSSSTTSTTMATTTTTAAPTPTTTPAVAATAVSATPRYTG